MTWEDRGNIRCLDGVYHPQVEDAIDSDGDVVVGNCTLLRDAVRFFFQTVHVSDLIDDGNKEL